MRAFYEALKTARQKTEVTDLEKKFLSEASELQKFELKETEH